MILLAAGGAVGFFSAGLISREQESDSSGRPQEFSQQTIESADAGGVAHASEPPRRVVLPAGKLATAGIETVPVLRQLMTHRHELPGRIIYNDDRHIEVTVPAGGILTKALVKPGDKVAAGQILAWLTSPEIGAARADVLQRQAQSELSGELLARAGQLEANVTELIRGIRSRVGFDTLQKQFSMRTLGDLRQELLGAYSQWLLAESVVKSSSDLAESGVLSAKTVQDRLAAVQSTRATLDAASEQASLDVWTIRSQAESAARDADRRLQIARQHLASLLLNEAAIDADSDMPDSIELGAAESELEHLSRVAIRAPFAGTIEQRQFSASERIQAGDSLFVLADTSTLWITAEIRENDWPAVSIQTGQALQVVVPAVGAEPLLATVHFIGREVSMESNAIPVVAVIDNSAALLRPGLFARVSVPVGSQPDALTIPEQAVMRHDEATFVFVRESDNTFRRADVITGTTDDGYLEVVSGLSDQDVVVVRGAFLLKSELLLESEE